MIYLDHQTVSKILNVSIASATLKEVKLPHTSIRGQIHVLIYGRMGSGKSSILRSIAKITKETHYPSLTRATLLGSVDKNTGLFTFPAVWEQRNSVLLIDEFHVGKNDQGARTMLNTLLPLLETDPEYKKPIGYRCNNEEKKDKDLFIKVKDNVIHCKTRFVFIANTMMNLRSVKMFELQALMSRCVIIPYYPNADQIKNKLKGEPSFEYKKIKILKKRITPKIYDKIIDFVYSKAPKEEVYMRLVGDLCRFYYIMGWDEDLFTLICSLTEY